MGAPGASCGRFSMTYSWLRFLFPFGGQLGFSKWLIMTQFSHPGKKYNRSCLLSLENNARYANVGAKTLTIKKLQYLKRSFALISIFKLKTFFQTQYTKSTAFIVTWNYFSGNILLWLTDTYFHTYFSPIITVILKI